MKYSISASKTLPLSIVSVFLFQGCFNSGASNLSATQNLSCSHASNWQTVDDVSNAAGSSVVTDSLGNVYVIGSNPTNNLPLLRVSSNLGKTWTSLSSISGFGTLNAIAIDKSDNLYLLSNPYIVSKSTDQGKTWVTVDNFPSPVSATVQAQHSVTLVNHVYGFGADNSGNIFTVGDAAELDMYGDLITHAIIRKSSNRGSSWSTVDDYLDVNDNLGSTLNGITNDAQGNLYAYGSGAGTNGNFFFLLKSTDHGDTWSTLSSESGSGAAKSMTLDSSGNIYLAGYVGQGSGTWLIQKSSNNGQTFQASDNFAYLSMGSEVSVVLSDLSGHLFALGDGVDNLSPEQGITHAIARRSDDNGGTWSTSNDYVYSSTTTSTYAENYYMSATVDNSGNIFTAGIGTDSSGTMHLITQMLPCN